MKAKAGTCGGWLSLDEGVEDRAEEGRGTEGCETWIRDEAFLDAQSCPGRAIVLEQVRTDSTGACVVHMATLHPWTF